MAALAAVQAVLRVARRGWCGGRWTWRVQALAAVEVAAAVPRSADHRSARDVEAFWWRGTPSLRKKRGVDLPDPVQVSMPAVRLQLQETSCSPMSRIACLRSKPIRVSRFWTWQPEWLIPALP